MSNTLTFTTTIDQDTQEPVDYDVSGSVILEGQEVPVGFYTAKFERAFNELAYWTRLVKNVEVKYTTKTFSI